MTSGQKTSSLLLAGLAAYAVYKISKMSADDKTRLANSIKDQGKKMMDQINPRLKEKFAGMTSNKSYEESLT
jgi:hypothetical protein